MGFVENLLGDTEQDEKDEKDEQDDLSDENSDGDKNPEQEKAFKPANDIEKLRWEICRDYLKARDKQNFLMGLLHGKEMISQAIEYILDPQQAEEETLDLSGLNLPPEIAQFATALKGGGSSLVPSLFQKFTGVSIGYDEEKELNPMKELMAKPEYQTDKVKLEELKKSIKSGIDIQTLLAAPVVVGTGTAKVISMNNSTESQEKSSKHAFLFKKKAVLSDTINPPERAHNGIDISAGGEGEPVYSIGNGKVVVNSYDDLSGNYIIYQLDPPGSQLISVCHLKEKSLLRAPDKDKDNGERVIAGETVIGKMGNTGYSFSPHVHFVVRDADGKVLDPLKEFPDIFTPENVTVKKKLADRGVVLPVHQDDAPLKMAA